MTEERSREYNEVLRRMRALGIKDGGVRDLPHEERVMSEITNDGRDDGGTWGLYEYPLAMAYAPYQLWRSIYNDEEAFNKGTLFSELYLPFYGCEGDLT